MAQGGRNYNNIFDTWKPGRLIGFWFIVIAMIASAVVLTIPVGLAFFLMVFLLPIIWKDPDDDGDPTNGMMVYGSRAYKVASFMSLLKNAHRKDIFNPIVLLGFGPPEDDVQKGLTRSFFYPPTRLSAYWALFFGIASSFIDFFIHPYLYPLWGEGTLPFYISMVFSAIGFFMGYQALWTARRYQLAMTMSGVDHTPAVMLNALPKNGTVKSALIRSLIVMIIAIVTILFAAFIVSTSGVKIPWVIVSIVAALLGVSFGLWSLNKTFTDAYREEFNYQIERRDFWNNIFSYKKDLIPFMEAEAPVPGEPGKPGGPPEGEPMGEPHVWAATFSYPTGANFNDYVNEAPKLRSSMNDAEMIAIIPIPKKDPVSGRTLPGTISDKGFRIWWSDENVTINELLDSPDITIEHKEIAIRALVTDPLANIRQIGRCNVHSHSMMTAPDSRVNIMRISLVVPEGVTEATFTKNMETIIPALGVKWARAKKSQDANSRSTIELFIGDGRPNNPGIEFPKGAAASRYRAKLLSAEWEYSFAINKIAAPSGAPSMMLQKTTDMSNEFVFDLPAGISLRDVKKASEAIMSSSGNTFMEIQEGITGEKQFTRREKRDLEKFKRNNNSLSQFTVIASPTHPLEKIFYFKDYEDELITGREPGVAKIGWSPGVQSDGSLAKHSFASDMAHLVLAGSSGSGKSVLIYSMICQLAANNDPRDLQFWIIDPKIGFQDFQFIDSVTRYVDNWTPKPDVFFESCRDLLYDAVEEMKRRNEIFRFAYDTMEPQQLARLSADDKEPIDKLGVARRVALKAGPKSDGSPNDLMQPYLFIIIDECALLFTGGIDKETKDIQAEILYYASRLARESRSAGIHVLFATQYPTNASLPSLIKQQSGRIGLMASNSMASMVIIDEPGLEDLFIKGTGKIQSGKSYRDFRGFLLEDGANDIHSMRNILDSLPKRQPTELDGPAFEKAQNSNGLMPGDANYVEAPEVDESVYGVWNNDPSGSATRLRNAIDSGKADKAQGLLSLIDGMSDEELNNMSLEDFKKKISDYEKKVSKRKTKK